VGWWSARLLRIVNIDARLDGPAPGAAGAPVMIASNHVSWLDIFLISSVHPTRFVAKSEIRDWPLAGWIVEKAGTLFIRRARRHDIGRINEAVQAALANGDCVGLFPEGTTTEGDELLKFHSALFEAALANGAWVHPAAIRYEHPDGSLCRAAAYAGELSFMQSMALIMRQPAIVARIAFAPAIDCAGRDRRAIAALARERIASLLGLERPDTPPGTACGPRGEPR
jgi:1-acyl-sn-glycerol-3-phosphate acyltransferase